eukprot:CAMPEP_0202450486 /NCGR_PEP_ID=MMETSP1360-20130828/9091_1 /ASSEMBLY_ACC=CAM_ASM_000848 /TAXON_ID=515479 /ORGANISM="Licmophora paradoxa, Strain CCMP2313" /LENGTH=256 /DNA_ID=CAMNT_0049068779 /DNA_START=41 /DNA_END=811 /DNA_ORIENTATION=+
MNGGLPTIPEQRQLKQIDLCAIKNAEETNKLFRSRGPRRKKKSSRTRVINTDLDQTFTKRLLHTFLFQVFLKRRNPDDAIELSSIFDRFREGFSNDTVVIDDVDTKSCVYSLCADFGTALGNAGETADIFQAIHNFGRTVRRNTTQAQQDHIMETIVGLSYDARDRLTASSLVSLAGQIYGNPGTVDSTLASASGSHSSSQNQHSNTSITPGNPSDVESSVTTNSAVAALRTTARNTSGDNGDFPENEGSSCCAIL